MPKKLAWQWEKLDEYEQNATFRAKVMGGWVIHHKSSHPKLGISETMVFVPDRDHEWTIVPSLDQQIAKDIAKKTVEPSDFKASAK